jgi:hypothetical protein
MGKYRHYLGGLDGSTMVLIHMPPGSSLAMRCAVFAGFILGNYCYAQLWMAEGRQAAAREARPVHSLEAPIGPPFRKYVRIGPFPFTSIMPRSTKV